MNSKNKFFDVKMMAEAGVMIALAILLSLIELYKMPQGGTITAASMLPIIIFSMRWGVARALVVGALYGLLSTLVDPFIIHPAQFILDYPLPYLFIGLSGMSFMKDKKSVTGYIPFIILGFILRIATHVASGVIFFASYAPPNQSPLAYSLTYNLGYLVPEMLITIVILFLVWRPLNRLIEKQG